MISEEELYVLSYYRACELSGSVLFGKLAFVTDIDEIRIPLTHHCLEEAEHAWMWTETIKDMGKTPEKVTKTYQTEYGKEFGMPKNALEILCLTQVFEKRTLNHFRKHLKMKDVHPRVKETLQKMIEDEEGHLSWVKEKLDEHAEKHDRKAVEETMNKLLEIDERVYRRILQREPFKEFFGEIDGR